MVEAVVLSNFWSSSKQNLDAGLAVGGGVGETLKPKNLIPNPES